MAKLPTVGDLPKGSPDLTYRLCPLPGTSHLCVAIAFGALPALPAGHKSKGKPLTQAGAAAHQAAYPK